MASVRDLTSFIRRPGAFESIRCGVCGSICDVERGAMGPTCFVEAMAGRSREHDRFECPHTGEAWHDRCLIFHSAWRHIDDWELTEVAREELLAAVRENAGGDNAEWVESASECEGGAVRWRE